MVKSKFLIRPTDFYAVSLSKCSSNFEDEVCKQTGFFFSLCCYFM